MRGIAIMSTANIYTKEKVDELLGKFFTLPSNVTINTNGITIGTTQITSAQISVGESTTSKSTINTTLVLKGTVQGDIIPLSKSVYDLGQSDRKWQYLWVDNIGSSSYPSSGIYSSRFACRGGLPSQVFPLIHMENCKKYSSYASSMVVNNTTSYIGNSYWNYGYSPIGTYQVLKICMGTFVKAGGDNARKTVSFPINFASAPLVILQMGGGNSPGNIQYRNGELVAEITQSGFTTASSCSEQARMCYIAIGW